MSWNKPSSAPQPPPKKSAPPTLKRGLLAGAIIVLLGAAALLLFRPSAATPKREAPKDRGLIKEVTPAAAPTNAAPVPLKKRDHRTAAWREERIKKITDQYGTNLPPDLKSYVYYLRNPPQRSFKVKTPYAYLSHRSERDIADLLMAEPGTFMVIQPEYGESFNQDFANALLDKIEIEPDDSEEVRNVKEFVIAAKKEIADLVRSGGKLPNELMNEHAAMLFKMSGYEANLASELQKAKDNPDLTDADVEDMFKAANVLRKEKGLPEIALPNLSRRSLVLQRRQKRAERKAAAEAAKAAASQAKQSKTKEDNQ